jgi:TRAP-type C4-dicarboxylate transport system permease small subunit
LRLAIWVTVIVVALITVFYGFLVLELLSGNNQKSVVSQIPMTIPYAAIPTGFLLIAAASIERLVQHLRVMGWVVKQGDSTVSPDETEV